MRKKTSDLQKSLPEQIQDAKAAATKLAAEISAAQALAKQLSEAYSHHLVLTATLPAGMGIYTWLLTIIKTKPS